MSRNRRRLVALTATTVAILLLPLAVAAAGGRFTDDDSSVFEGDIEWMAGAGLTTGCSDGAFCPEDGLTRGQMAAFIRRFAQYLGAEDGVPNEADNATSLQGSTKNDLLSFVQGDRVVEATLGDGDNVVTLQSISITRGPRDAAIGMAEMSGYFTVNSATEELAENHQPVCWISTTELTAYNATTLADTPIAWATMPESDERLAAGTRFYQTVPFTVTTAERIGPGESMSFYFQCVDLRDGGTEQMAVRASTILTTTPIAAGGLNATDSLTGPGVPPVIETVPVK